MTDFDLGEQFRLITMLIRPFCHLITVEEQLACLKCVHCHLEVEGHLVFEVPQVSLAKLARVVGGSHENSTTPEVELSNGRRVSRSHRIVGVHRAEQVYDMEIIHHVIHSNGRAEEQVWEFPFRLHFRYEVEHLLARCGFRVAELYGDFDRSPLTDDSLQMVYVAQKA